MNLQSKLLLACIFTISIISPANAQRMTDQLDRGLLAVKTDGGVYCSWRILGEEYFDVTYNLYRDGVKVNAEPLNVSNYVDAAGTSSSQYTVAAVIKGQEQAQSKAFSVWEQNYLEIAPDHGDLTSTYIPNDACCADVDGDGELEILMKFDNQSEINASYPKEGYNGEYSIAEVFKLDGTKLWWLDFGPNMGDFQNNEQNIVAYDWDQDGKAEAIIRAADGTTIHAADGQTYVIGDATKNYRSATGGGANWFMHEGAEYLVYINGETGVPYQIMDYPLKRLEDGETSLEAAWGDGYGHRSTKHFFGAPYLDGLHPSIFLARGIYTRHKMIALDVNPETHELTERWRWNCSQAGSPWYGQGYHNYAVADVDWDGRDEICFGSMVIDDNGKGLSTTGLGHGDAQHHGDFNPYIHGHEIYACNEDAPDNNFRDATTSKIYYRKTSNQDDGRAMCGNFSNDFPGAMGMSGHDTPISCVVNDHIDGLTGTGVTVNMRIYWDGDLCDESYNGTGTRNSTGAIYKYGKSDPLEKLTGSLTNNDTKATPCYLGDILGDWREEVMMRTKDNHIRIYTTTIPTEWRNYTLWHDMQYRNAMVWQMCGYNQPPHVSYFLGELEGITIAPPPLTTAGREVVTNGSLLSKDGQTTKLLCETNDMTVEVPDGFTTDVLIDNAPSWVQGHDNNDNITTEYFTHTLTGGAFTGDMRLVKQGDGILVLPNVTETYTGPTDVWAGTLCFDGTMQNSSVWLNRFARLNSNGGRFMKGIKMDYAAELCPGGEKTGTIETSSLQLGFGSRVIFDVASDGSADCIKAGTLTIEKKDWQYGPQYAVPVFEIAQGDASTPLAAGKYLIVETETIEGQITDIILEGTDGLKASLVTEDNKIYLNVEALRQPTEITWDGGSDGIWDLAHTENFILADGKKDFFVTGDIVNFTDNGSQTTVSLSNNVSPSNVIFDNNEKDYVLSGESSITGEGSLTKRGTGSLTIKNTNMFTGGTIIENGTLNVSSLANSDGTEYGALGGVDQTITLTKGGTLSTSATIVSSQPIKLADGGGIIELASGKTLTQNGSITSSDKSALQKNGAGILQIGGSAKYKALYLNQGTVQGGEINNVHQYPDTVVINGGTLKDPDNIYSYSSNKAIIVVPEGKSGTWYLDARCDYRGKLLGSGSLTVNVTSVRCNMQGDWSKFNGTLNFQKKKTGSYDPSIQWNNDYGLGQATVTGEFDNNGKNVAIGTITDKATLTGSGQYTANRIELTVKKMKGIVTSTYFTVAGTLNVTDEINITISGSGYKAGDQFTFWKVGALNAGSATINLPELPDGLYWDTTSLLKKDGILKITDTPSAISDIHTDNETDGRIYTLGGAVVEPPLPKGIYIQNGKKIIIK